MNTLPIRARIYLVLIVVAGAGVLAVFGELPDLGEVPTFVALALATLASSTLKLRLPTLKNRATMSVSFVVDFAALLILGPDKAMLVAGIGAVGQSTIIVAHRNPPHRILFNVACILLTMKASGEVYGLVGGHLAPLAWPHDATAVLAAGLVYFLLNTGAIAGAVALSTYQPVRRVWEQNFLWGGPSYFIGAAASALIADVVASHMWAVLPIVSLPIYVTHRAYNIFAGRLEEDHRHREVIESLNEGMAVVERTGRIALWNDALERILGIPRGRALGCTLVEAVPDLAVTILPQVIASVLETGKTETIEHFALHRDTGRRILQVRVFVFVNGVTIFWNDITERATAQEQLRHAALHDTLTGLPNRALFAELLAQVLERSKQHREHVFAVLFLDLDRFKVVNDSLGHLCGDEMLVAVARRLAGCMRDGDVIARMGGDEFTILLNDLHNVSEASLVAQRLHEALREPFSVRDRDVFVTASIGIALSPTGYQRPDQILRDADTAMYRAKALGKARHELFDASMHARAVDRLSLEGDLRRAIERGEFALHYQPIVALKSGRWTGFEALLRWQRGGRYVSPAEFVPVIEEMGLIEPLGAWVLQEACRQMAVWRRQFPSGPALGVTVNVSARQLNRTSFVDIVRAAIEAAKLQPEDLRLEITESTLVENPEMAEIVLRDLRVLGVKVYLDDFGTGFSSLSYLHRFPVDTLKIDRSFIASLSGSNRQPAFVESIVTLAKTLGTHVIAEGVETEAQLGELVRLGCREAQGFLFAAALPPRTAEALLARGEEGITFASTRPAMVAAAGRHSVEGRQSRLHPAPAKTGIARSSTRFSRKSHDVVTMAPGPLP